MKANEFRIGNLINFPFHNENVKIVGIYLNGDNVRSIQVETLGTILAEPILEQFKVIPLTEKWFLDFGFKKRKNQHLFNWNNQITISQYIDSNSNYFFINNKDLSKKFMEIEYVHQLQNLYFALTGEELQRVDG